MNDENAESEERASKQELVTALTTQLTNKITQATKSKSNKKEQIEAIAKEVVTQAVTISSYHSGPLPRAAELARYDEVVPGAAERIIEMAERQQKHEIESEHFIIRDDAVRAKLGFFCGTFVLFFIAVVALVAVLLGHPGFGAILGATAIAPVIGRLVWGRPLNHIRIQEESIEKDKTKSPK